jgi:hypothetical protein
MSRETHVRFCESRGVRFPRPLDIVFSTRPRLSEFSAANSGKIAALWIVGSASFRSWLIIRGSEFDHALPFGVPARIRLNSAPCPAACRSG